MNTAIGKNSGKNATTMKNCVFIGINAGAEMIDTDNVVIIGDNIRDLNRSTNTNTLFIGDRIAIGDTLFGEKCNLKELILKNSGDKILIDTRKHTKN